MTAHRDQLPPPPPEDLRAALARTLHACGDLIAAAPLTPFDLTTDHRTQPAPARTDRAVVQALTLLTEACHAYATGLRHASLDGAEHSEHTRHFYAFASRTVDRSGLQHLTACITDHHDTPTAHSEEPAQ